MRKENRKFSFRSSPTTEALAEQADAYLNRTDLRFHRNRLSNDWGGQVVRQAVRLFSEALARGEVLDWNSYRAIYSQHAQEQKEIRRTWHIGGEDDLLAIRRFIERDPDILETVRTSHQLPEIELMIFALYYVVNLEKKPCSS